MHHDPAAPVYTIGQVAELTNVPEDTIRSWERRFGVPEPQRSAGKQRRYAEAEVDVIRRIQAARDDGLPMDAAIARARQTDGKQPDQAKTLVAQRPPEPGAPTLNDDRHPSVALVQHLAAADWPNAGTMLREAAWATSIAETCAKILAPATQLIFAAYRQGQLDQVEARLALAWIERKLWSALDGSLPSGDGPTVLVVGIGGGESVYMALCVAVAQASNGCQVLVEPRTTSMEEAMAMVSGHHEGDVHLVPSSAEASEIAATIARQILGSSPDRVVQVHGRTHSGSTEVAGWRYGGE